MGAAPIVTAIVLIAAAQSPLAVSDPLGPARSGQMQCYMPDAAKKTCRTLAQYIWAPDGSVQNPAQEMISDNPVIIMRGSSPVVVRGNAVCATFVARTIEEATFTVNGQLAPLEVSSQIRMQLLMASTDRIGKEICTSYVQNGNQFVEQVKIDGVAHPELSDKMIWVKPTDGFRVGP
jgi:hypothetical protein